MKVSLVSLGCRTNQAEIQQIESEFRRAGHQIVSLSSLPDVCVVNTCAVTSRAESDSRRLIRKALEKAGRVVATGCFVELNHSDMPRTGHLLALRNDEKGSIVKVIGNTPATDVLSIPDPATRHRPVVKVQDGCESSCSYCVVPLVRGKSQSVPAQEVVERLSSYHSEGFGEVVLSGIHLGSYGRDLQPPTTLARLLKVLIRDTAVARIRLSSIEIGEIDEELLEVLPDKRLCRHLHVPLQSGDDSILRAMNRPYVSMSFMSTIERLLSLMPDLALGTDVMVGFPGEGPDEYLRTLGMVREVPFAYLHVFPFSPRPKTTAAALPRTVPEKDTRLRVEMLRKISDMKKSEYIKKNLGLRHEAVVETARGPEYICTTGNYIKALVASPARLLPGSLVDVVITGCEGGVATAIPAP